MLCVPVIVMFNIRLQYFIGQRVCVFVVFLHDFVALGLEFVVCAQHMHMQC